MYQRALRPDELMHWEKRNHKYLRKVRSGNGWRYIYEEATKKQKQDMVRAKKDYDKAAKDHARFAAVATRGERAPLSVNTKGEVTVKFTNNEHAADYWRKYSDNKKKMDAAKSRYAKAKKMYESHPLVKAKKYVDKGKKILSKIFN